MCSEASCTDSVTCKPIAVPPGYARAANPNPPMQLRLPIENIVIVFLLHILPIQKINK